MTESMPETLTGAQRRRLRALAHALPPAVMVGKQGATEAIIAAADAALAAHELINVKIAAARGERGRIAEAIAARTHSLCAGIIGSKAIFYRPNPDPAKRAVRLERG